MKGKTETFICEDCKTRTSCECMKFEKKGQRLRKELFFFVHMLAKELVSEPLSHTEPVACRQSARHTEKR